MLVHYYYFCRNIDDWLLPLVATDIKIIKIWTEVFKVFLLNCVLLQYLWVLAVLAANHCNFVAVWLPLTADEDYALLCWWFEGSTVWWPMNRWCVFQVLLKLPDVLLLPHVDMLLPHDNLMLPGVVAVAEMMCWIECSATAGWRGPNPHPLHDLVPVYQLKRYIFLGKCEVSSAYSFWCFVNSAMNDENFPGIQSYLHSVECILHPCWYSAPAETFVCYNIMLL